MTASYVYFLTPVQGGPIKIGCSATPQARLETFMAWSPVALKLLGAVPGSLKDEQFLHRCFADCHSHNEWFRPELHLVEAVAGFIRAGNLDAARMLTPKGSVRKKRRELTPLERQRYSLRMKVNWVERKLRAADKNAPWHAPEDVSEILNRWSRGLHPAVDEIARVERFLADPASQAILPSWQRKVAA